MNPLAVQLPAGRVWLRVAKPTWTHLLDPSPARVHGGRWNPPGSFDVLYLNGDVLTARAQIARMLEGQPATLEDLSDDAPYLLVAARIPRRQRAADAVTEEGLKALGLPATYPFDGRGLPMSHDACRPIGAAVRSKELRGVWSRTAALSHRAGRELAWFPARRSSRARPVWAAPLPYAAWRRAVSWDDLGLSPQADPHWDLHST